MTTNNNNRRDFLKNFGMILGGTYLLSYPWLSSLKASDTTSRKINIGIIGTGSRGRLLMRYLNQIPSANIIALCDDYPPSLTEAKRLIKKEIFTTDDYRRLLEIKDLDGVVIATPLHLHAQQTIDALNAGVHVFVEKSMARTIADCYAMVQTHKKTGKHLQTGHQRLFDIQYLSAIERIKNGEIGKVTQMRAYWHRNDVWRRNVPESHLERKINWRLYKEYSGGLMTELGSHQIQVANWVLGEVPHMVVGSGSLNYWADGRDVYDNVNLVYKYPSNVHLVYDSMTSNAYYGIEEQIIGNKGVMELESGKVYPEKQPTPAGIVQMVNNIEKGIVETIPIGGASWAPDLAKQKKGYPICDEYPLPDSVLLQMQAFVNSIETGIEISGMVNESYYASVASLMGEQAMYEEKAIYFPKEYTI